MSVTLHNPILPGFYPDPSICRVGDDYYLVTSSFSFFPGVPLFHSKDLAHWEQIGHVLDRPKQLPLAPYDLGLGIFAPTIRYHEDMFYCITTNASFGGNFIVTSSDPAGDWSDPHWIEGAEGIDPSLFWDEDGTAYYTGASEFDTRNGMRPYIWLSEIDLTRFELVGEKHLLWGGALADPAWTEAPHLYKKNGWYYLLAAEGGTEHFHSEIVARSRSVTGPYESFRGNPILTQRHLGVSADITNAGHGDLIECQDGSWYMVFLASRPYGGYHKNLGRETFIAPVSWEEDWPVVSPGTGRVLMSYEGPNLPLFSVPSVSEFDDFDEPSLRSYFNTLGTPEEDTCKLEDGCLQLRLYERRMGYDMAGRDAFKASPTPLPMGFLGRRQQHMSFTAKTRLLFCPQEGESAGITVLQHDYQQLRLEMTCVLEKGTVLRAFKCYKSLEPTLINHPDRGEYKEELLGEVKWEEQEAILCIRATLQDFTLSGETSKGEEILLARTDGGFLGSETAGGYIGAYIGMFAYRDPCLVLDRERNGSNKAEEETKEKRYASFAWFSYQGQ